MQSTLVSPILPPLWLPAKEGADTSTKAEAIRVITNFILKALAGEDVIVYGTGSQTRSFQYIDDLVEGIDRMMKKDAFQGPVNLGNPGEITMQELAEKVIAETKSKSKIVFTEEDLNCH